MSHTHPALNRTIATPAGMSTTLDRGAMCDAHSAVHGPLSTIGMRTVLDLGPVCDT